jgi:hypothetical protein
MAFEQGTRRLHRFEREARVTAALNDPLIRTLHDVGHRGKKDSGRSWQSIGDVICGEQVRWSDNRSSLDAAATGGGVCTGTR